MLRHVQKQHALENKQKGRASAASKLQQRKNLRINCNADQLSVILLLLIGKSPLVEPCSSSLKRGGYNWIPTPLLIFKIRSLLKKVKRHSFAREDEKCLTDWHYRIN